MEAQGQGAETTPKPGKITPRLRLPIVLAVSAAVAVVAWAYADRYGRKHDLEIDRLKVDIQQLGDQSAPPLEEGAEPAPAPAGMRTYAGALSDRRFQIDLPDGTALSSSGGEFAYVMVDPPAESEPLPLMAIRIVPKSAGAFDGAFGTTVEAGDSNFWLYLWEGLEWQPFEEVVASFKAL